MANCPGCLRTNCPILDIELQYRKRACLSYPLPIPTRTRIGAALAGEWLLAELENDRCTMLVSMGKGLDEIFKDADLSQLMRICNN